MSIGLRDIHKSWMPHRLVRRAALASLALPLIGCQSAVTVLSGGFIVGPYTPPAPAPGQGITLGALSPNGRLVAFSYFADERDTRRRRPILYDWQHDTAWSLPAGPNTSLRPVGFSPDGGSIIAARADRRVEGQRSASPPTLEVMSLPTLTSQTVAQTYLPNLRHFALHPDGGRLIMAEWSSERRLMELVLRNIGMGAEAALPLGVVLSPRSNVVSLCFFSPSEIVFLHHDTTDGTPFGVVRAMRLRVQPGEPARALPFIPALLPNPDSFGQVAAPGDGSSLFWTAPGRSTDSRTTLAYMDIFERRNGVTRPLTQEGWAHSDIVVSRDGAFVAYLEAPSGQQALSDLVILHVPTGTTRRPRVIQRLLAGSLRAAVS